MQQAQAVQPQISGEVYQQAAIYQLGTPVATFTPLLSNPLTIIAMVLGIIIADVILVAFIYSLGYILYILIAIPIAAIIYGINALRHCNLKVYQFSYGLVRVKGTRVDAIRWDQVESVWQKITKGRYSTSRTYTLRRSDGASFTFTHALRHVEQLGQNMQQTIAAIHTPMAMTAYNAGNTLHFGPLHLNYQGISNGKEVLPWHEMQGVEIKQGYVNIKRMGKTFNWSRIAVANIPNVLVFLNVVNHARSGQIPR